MNNQAAAYEAQQAATRFAVEQLRQANPHLVAGAGPAIAAKNIRIELKRAFPAVKFSVRTEHFSMGNAVRISWIDGPTVDQVDAIANRYVSGHFDSSTDCYEYRDDKAFPQAFGSAKYITTSRDFSDRMLSSVIGRVCRRLGGVDRSVEKCVADYKIGALWNVKTSGGCDLSREINIALSRHTYAIKKA